MRYFGQYAWGRVDEKCVVPIKGAFQETLANDDMNDATQECFICYIDPDIYEAAYLVLNYIKSRLLPGALIMFDEDHTFGAVFIYRPIAADC